MYYSIFVAFADHVQSLSVWEHDHDILVDSVSSSLLLIGNMRNGQTIAYSVCTLHPRLQQRDVHVVFKPFPLLCFVFLETAPIHYMQGAILYLPNP